MKFKVGDKVRIKSLDWYNENKEHNGIVVMGNYNFHETMSEYCGMTAIITDMASPHTHKKGGFYLLDIDEGRWSWEDCMLEDEVVTENKDVIEIEVDKPFKIKKGDANVLSKNNDVVNHPKWYTSHPSSIECIEITKHYDFCIGNAIKYLWRAGLKSEQGYSSDEKQIEDLKKAVWYINKKIEMLEK
jgi:hypothetical protein